MQFLRLGTLITELPSLFYFSVFFYALYLYLSPKKQPELSYDYFFLVQSVVLFKLLYALMLTILQYATWGTNPLTELLLHQPLNEAVPLFGLFSVFGFLHSVSWGYFFYYVLGRFWLSVILSLAAAYSLYSLIERLRRSRPASLPEFEPGLLLLLSLLVGWPNFIIFLILSLVFVLIYACVRFIQDRTAVITAAPGFLTGCLLVLSFGNAFTKFLGFGTLRV
jgi:hypothetical protein